MKFNGVVARYLWLQYWLLLSVLCIHTCTFHMNVPNYYIIMNLCPGDLASMCRAEVTALKECMEDGGEAEMDSELGEPPVKKRCIEKENETTSCVVKRRGRPRKPLKELQVRSLKSCDWHMYIIFLHAR